MRSGHREEAARLEARLRQMQNNMDREVLLKVALHI